MAFTELAIPSSLNTSESDLFEDFFIPVLAKSVRYDRGVGFFSSGWLRAASQGMVKFAEHRGYARWVTSPILSELDWKALQTGDLARTDDILRTAIEKNIEDLAITLEEDTLSALAWLVADEILDFKIALPRNKLEKGDFHDKFGIFYDAEENQISFNGSYNDSIQGTRNYESIKVFCSWADHFKKLVSLDENRFNKLWNNQDPNVRVFDLPEASRENIIRLRIDSRPYPDPGDVKYRGAHALLSIHHPSYPKIPDNITIRDYQIEAIEAWFSNDRKGLLEMATGTGKTITSLGASVKLFEQEKRLALIISCPYQHLVDQWYKEATNFGFHPTRAYRSRTTWLDDLNERIITYNHEDTTNICVITTHHTFSTDHFQESIKRISEPVMFIADEVHHLGSESRRLYFPKRVKYRLALSATPDRWFDEEGTEELRKYFGNTVYELSLANAIGLSLTEYYYYPTLVELTSEEMVEYKALSLKIGKLMAQIKNKMVIKEHEYLTHLLIKRAQILNTAANKISVISDLIDNQDNVEHSLFYCSPGQIDDVVRLLGWDKGLSVHRFTAREDISTRQELLSRFEKGELQALAAMHCLDEGVDVPSTRTAYILASSSNPRQFIQRRGRVLRKAPDKDFAIIYDLITIPPPISELDDLSIAAERSILQRELKRFSEFADSAINTQEAYETIWELATQYGILDF